jgi:hypothetical protein
MSDDVKFELPQAPQQKQRCCSGGALLALLIGIVVGSAVHVVFKRSATPPSAPSPATIPFNHDELTSLAEKLERNQLYVQAARTWQQVMACEPPEGEQRAEMLFRIGKNLNLGGAHEEAARYLLAAEAADDEERWSGSINKLLLESLSALGLEDVRTYQAKQRVSLAKKDDKPVAEIGGEPITSTDLDTFARQMVESQMAMQRSMMSPEQFSQLVETQLEQYRTPEGRQQVLQAYLSRELLYREALAKGLADQQEVRSRMLDVRQSVLIQAYMDDYLGESLQMTDTDIRNAYEAKKDQYMEEEAVKVDALIVANEDEKKAVDAALEGGTDFNELQAKYREEGESNPFDRWLTRDGWMPMVKEPKPVLAHLFLTDAGTVSPKWFETNDGKWVRFRLAERREQRQLSLDQCRDRVQRDLSQQKRQELTDQLQEKLRSKYEVVIHEEPTTQPGDDG